VYPAPCFLQVDTHPHEGGFEYYRIAERGSGRSYVLFQIAVNSTQSLGTSFYVPGAAPLPMACIMFGRKFDSVSTQDAVFFDGGSLNFSRELTDDPSSLGESFGSDFRGILV
jgi:hypothetical protein